MAPRQAHLVGTIEPAKILILVKLAIVATALP
jgi:hypothetical protein